MPRTQPITTRVRDLYDEYAELADRHIRLFECHGRDGTIDPHELADLAPLLERKRQIREELGTLIAEADDGLRVAMAFLHGGGTPSRHTRRLAGEYETLHGPVQIEHYQHTETRRSHGHGNDAA